MTIRSLSICLLGTASGAFLVGVSVPAIAASGDPARGAQLFGRACGARHSLVSGEHRTGPSLADVVGRKAGSSDGFHRYSPPLQSSGVVWDGATLDAWIADPQAFIPGTRMGFRGLPDAQARRDLIADLAQPEHAQSDAPQGGMMGMSGNTPPDLKTLGPEYQVTAIRYCGDTYEIATADGATVPFWEFNLRFKTDSSARGPLPGKPAIVGTGMMGDPRCRRLRISPGDQHLHRSRLLRLPAVRTSAHDDGSYRLNDVGDGFALAAGDHRPASHGSGPD